MWPSRREYTLEDCFPPDHIEEYVHKSLENAGLPSFDLMQLHTWEDHWVEDERWYRKMDDLRSQGLVHAIGISLNRWEPWNGVRTVRSGLIDAVQVIYNIFDQNPEDELFPACGEMDVAVIARVPFDEGTLTGRLSLESKWPAGRLAQHILCARKPENQRGARRASETAGVKRHEHARDGAALHPQRAFREHDHPRNAQS